MTDSNNALLRSKWRKPFWISLAFWTSIAVIVSAYLFSLEGAIYTFFAGFMLWAGFKITEVLVGLLTGLAKANATGVGFVFLAKILWWGGIFYLSRFVSEDKVFPIALGFASFLFSLLSAGFFLAGFPKISFENKADS